MDPLALQMQLRNNSTDLVNFCEDLKQWGEEMKRKEDSLKSGNGSSPIDVPLPRNKVKKTSDTPKPDKQKPTSSKRIKSIDYSAWEKFDVEAECAKVEEDKSDGDESGDLTDEYDESSRDNAIYEKEKGNKFVKHQRWDEAIECYTRAIQSYGYDPIFYANRALCYLKKEKYRVAESDCTIALQLDKTYVKAYQRRAAAREALNQLSEAHNDLLKVFDYEPNNKESKAALSKLEKKLESFGKKISEKTTEVQRLKSKFTISRQERKETTKQVQTAVGSSKAHISVTSSETNTKASEQTPKITAYWPSGNEVELVKSVFKPPHLRLKKPLKRINILDTNDTNVESLEKHHDVIQSWPRPENKSNIINCDELKVVERKIENSNKTEDQNVKELNRDLNENSKKESKFSKERSNNKIISDAIKETDTIEFNYLVPETSVQFNLDWRLLKSKSDWRYRYLKQVNPKKFSSIFKESLDYDVFSGIVHTLAEMFIEKNLPVYEYLLGLCEVKRFSMLAMFMSDDDKKDMLKLVDYMRNDNSLSKSDIDNLMHKYEL